MHHGATRQPTCPADKERTIVLSYIIRKYNIKIWYHASSIWKTILHDCYIWLSVTFTVLVYWTLSTHLAAIRSTEFRKRKRKRPADPYTHNAFTNDYDGFPVNIKDYRHYDMISRSQANKRGSRKCDSSYFPGRHSRGGCSVWISSGT